MSKDHKDLHLVLYSTFLGFDESNTTYIAGSFEKKLLPIKVPNWPNPWRSIELVSREEWIPASLGLVPTSFPRRMEGIPIDKYLSRR